VEIAPANLGKRQSYWLFMSAIVPRPITLVSTVGEGGVLKPALIGLLKR
jgi:hypothetical protein